MDLHTARITWTKRIYAGFEAKLECGSYGLLIFGVCFCISWQLFMQGSARAVRGTQCVILHKRALTQQKELPNAARRVRLAAIWALSLVAHIE